MHRDRAYGIVDLQRLLEEERRAPHRHVAPLLERRVGRGGRSGAEDDGAAAAEGADAIHSEWIQHSGSGIGELVSGYTTVTNTGGSLKLLNLNKRVKDLLQITKLYTVFEVHEDEAAAIRSYA